MTFFEVNEEHFAFLPNFFLVQETTGQSVLPTRTGQVCDETYH